MNPPRKLHIKSYGCQMNVYDAQRMVDTLAPEGFVETASVNDADLVILNTCHIREKASEKVYSELGRLRVVKDEAARNGRHMSIAVAGCVAQAEGNEIIRRAPVVDVVVGPQSYHHLPQLLAHAKSHGRALETEFPVEDKFGFLAPPKPDAIRARGISSFVTVQEGCDKFCTFCVVPYTRGAEVSRPVARIVDDVLRLADNGVREITLIGQNVNAYHGEGRRARNHLDRAERQCLSRRGTGRTDLVARHLAASPRRNSRHRSLALLDQPSPRRRRHADRGAS